MQVLGAKSLVLLFWHLVLIVRICLPVLEHSDGPYFLGLSRVVNILLILFLILPADESGVAALVRVLSGLERRLSLLRFVGLKSILPVGCGVLALCLHKLDTALVESILRIGGIPPHLTLLDQVGSLLLKHSPVMGSWINVAVVGNEFGDPTLLIVFVGNVNSRTVKVFRNVLRGISLQVLGLRVIGLHVVDLYHVILLSKILCEHTLRVDNHVLRVVVGITQEFGHWISLLILVYMKWY